MTDDKNWWEPAGLGEATLASDQKDSTLDKMNASRLALMIKDGLNTAFDHVFYDDHIIPTKKEAEMLFTGYFKTAEDRGAFTRYTSKCRMATWEEYYPAMPDRLLAIEAVERFGSTIDEDELPTEAKGYPYQKEEVFFIRGYDEEEGYYSDYWGDVMPKADELSEGEEVARVVRWTIKDPTHLMVVDIYFTPTKTADYIKLNVITPTQEEID
jgi:hypothetical protein